MCWKHKKKHIYYASTFLTSLSKDLMLLKDVPPPGFLHGDCTRNHTEKKYRSYKVNF